MSDALHLDYATHTYHHNGKRVPGVTDSLKQAGVIDLSGIPPRILKRAAERGKAAHLAFDYLDRGTLDRDSLAPELEGHVQAVENFYRDTGFVVALTERRVYHPIRRYAGTFDRTGVIGKWAIILDFKTGLWQDPYFSQLVLYGHAHHSDPRRFRYIGLQTMETGRYRVHEMRPRDFDYYSQVGFAAIAQAHKRIQEEGAAA